MSTRCNVVLRSKGYPSPFLNDPEKPGELWFYRHSDGYPDGVMPTLGEFMSMLSTRAIRRDLMQCAGWLVLLGHEEYAKAGYGGTLENHRTKAPCKAREYGNAWKCGAYEPTTGEHGDIEYLYEVDVDNATLTVNGRPLAWEGYKSGDYDRMRGENIDPKGVY